MGRARLEEASTGAALRPTSSQHVFLVFVFEGFGGYLGLLGGTKPEEREILSSTLWRGAWSMARILMSSHSLLHHSDSFSVVSYCRDLQTRLVAK